MIRRLLPILLALVFLGLVAGVADGATILVPEDQPSIADAMAVALASDEISVAPGTYLGNVVFPRDGITLRSRVRHQAVLDGQGSGHVVSFNPVSGSIEGFVIRNSGGTFYAGVFTSQSEQRIVDNIIEPGQGAGIVVSSRSVAWIERNVIRDTGNYKDGVRVATAADATIVGNLVIGAHNGIDVSGGYLGKDSHAQIVNNTIIDAEFTGVYVGDVSVELYNNLIVGGRFGVTLTGPCVEDPLGYISALLDGRQNDVWGQSDMPRLAELATFSPDGPGCSWSGPFDFAPDPGLELDPLFTGPQNWRPAAGSPTIDAGDASLLPVGAIFDLDGNARVVGGEVDLGAYENLGSTSVPRRFIAELAIRPNPANPRLTVSLELPREGDWTLVIYGVDGRRVKSLHEGPLAAGRFETTWDGRDDGGRAVASGVFHVRAWSAEGAVSSKATIVR